MTKKELLEKGLSGIKGSGCPYCSDCYGCSGCSNYIKCTSQKDKKYTVLNIQLTEQEYKEFVSK